MPTNIYMDFVLRGGTPWVLGGNNKPIPFIIAYILAVSTCVWGSQSAEVKTARSESWVRSNPNNYIQPAKLGNKYHTKGFPRSARFSSEDHAPTQTYVDFQRFDFNFKIFGSFPMCDPRADLGNVREP